MEIRNQNQERDMNKKWQIYEVDEEKVEELSNKYNLNNVSWFHLTLQVSFFILTQRQGITSIYTRKNDKKRASFRKKETPRFPGY